jgi:predicted DsbA family dithiol-disulfide isomerase
MLANPRKLAREDLDAQAKALGLGGARWKAALDGDAHGDEVEADKRAASAIGVEGTPAFVIAPTGGSQGYALVGAQPYGHFRRLVEKVLAERSPTGGAASAAASRQP